MRIAPFLAAAAALGVLAGCTETAQQVSAAPPTVSYQVVGADLGQANAEAGRYCSQYGMSAQLYGTQPSGNGSVASYGCTGGPAGASYAGTGYPSAPVYGSTTPVAASPPVYGTTTVQCADFMHQGRPGGSDYVGPPVPGCPQQ